MPSRTARTLIAIGQILVCETALVCQNRVEQPSADRVESHVVRRSLPSGETVPMNSDIATKRKVTLEACLEAARIEIVRRLEDRGLPTSVPLQRVVVKDNSENTGWSTDWETIQAISLRLREVEIQVRDESVPHILIGLRDQLQPLAVFLNDYSDLGTERPAGMWPDATGPEAVLLRVLSPMAITYIADLGDAATPDPVAVAQIDHELGLLCDPAKVFHISQLALAGLKVPGPLGPYKQVSLRSLSPTERGAIEQEQLIGMSAPRTSTTDFVIPRSFRHFAPTSLLEVRSSRPKNKRQDVSQLPNRVALAFYLAGFDIGALGFLTGFDVPRWASMFSHTPFPVTEKIVTDAPISEEQFRAIVDLAYKIPNFGGAEGSGKEIVLYRVLRGCGAQDSGFLDFAIALEAALLGGATSELAYRFSLYGALFLQQERDPNETFEKLRNIYSVRSKLVHGTRVKPESRRTAEIDAGELAKAITRKAVEDGWPHGDALDELALQLS